MVKEHLLWDHVLVCGLLKEAARRKLCNSSHGQSRRVCTSGPGQMPWPPFLQSAYKQNQNDQCWTNKKPACLFHCHVHSGLLLVINVAGVVSPHQLIETLTPPRGQMQSHVEVVFHFRMWVSPVETILLNFSHFLLHTHKKNTHRLTSRALNNLFLL